MENLEAVVAVVLALSVASERLVEIVKSALPFLTKKQESDETKEAWRKGGIQLLAVASGIGTAFLAQPALGTAIPEAWRSTTGVLALGLLASGGSGFWNSIQQFLWKVKKVPKTSG